MSRLAFCGSGAITAVHALAARAVGAEVIAVASRDPDHAAQRAETVGAQVVAYGQLPAGADVVVVATPPPHHAEAAVQATEAGAAALVEKPLAATLADADTMLGAVDAGARLAYAENLLFAPPVRAALELVPGLGPLTHLSARVLQERPPWGGFISGSWGGGVLFDLGVHPMAVVLQAAAPAVPTSVRAELDSAEDLDVDDAATVWIRFDTGLVATLEVSWRATSPVWDLQASSAAGVVRLELFPTVGLERDGHALALPPVDVDPELPSELGEFGYVDQLRQCLDAFATGRNPSTGTIEFGRYVLDVICGAYESAARAGAETALPYAGSRQLTPLEIWRGRTTDG